MDAVASPPGGRARRRRHRHRRRAGLVGAVVALVVLVAGVAVVSTVSAGSEGEAAPPPPPPTTVVPPPVGPDGAPLPPPRPLDVGDPLRLYIAGDSLAGALAFELAPLVAGTGVVAPTYDSHAGSGLASDDLIDWAERAATEPDRLDAEAVVFVMGTNDFWVVDDPADPTAAWRGEYAAEVATVVDALTDGGTRPLIWVGAPVMADPAMSAQVAAINAVVIAQLAQHPDVVYVDAYAFFGPDGSYTETLPGPEGQLVTVRLADGVHFTSAGSGLLAEQVFHHLDARWRLAAQAEPDRAQPVDVSPGGEGHAPG